MGAFSAASNALKESPNSNINEAGLKKEEKAQVKTKGQEGRPENSKLASAENQSNNRARPANQHGVRSAPKFSSDTLAIVDQIKSGENISKILEMLEKR